MIDFLDFIFIVSVIWIGDLDFRLGSHILKNEFLIFSTEHCSDAHLTNHRSRFARREILGQMVASPAIFLEAFLAFRGKPGFCGPR
jgi:hypothetical protein